jgi:hypothetical protein
LKEQVCYSIVENNFTKLLDVPTYSDNTGGVLPGEGGTMKAALNITTHQQRWLFMIFR